MNALTGCTSADLRATQNLRATHFFLLLHGRLVCACAMHIVCLLIALREMSARPLLCAQRGAKRFLLADLVSAYEGSAPDLRITRALMKTFEREVNGLRGISKLQCTNM